MNNRQYKVIFSRVLNQLVVVSELAKSAGKAAVDCVETHFSSNSNKINGLDANLGKTPLTGVAFALMLSLGFVWMPQAQAQEMAIRADKSAPGNQQPTVLKTANGLPQVNIQTPSAGGVSRNQYTQFDVPSRAPSSTTPARRLKPKWPAGCRATRILRVAKLKSFLTR